MVNKEKSYEEFDNVVEETEKTLDEQFEKWLDEEYAL